MGMGIGPGTGAGIRGGLPEEKNVAQLVQEHTNIYARKFQGLLDRSTPHVVERWIVTGVLFLLFLLNVVLRQGVSGLQSIDPSYSITHPRAIQMRARCASLQSLCVRGEHLADPSSGTSSATPSQSTSSTSSSPSCSPALTPPSPRTLRPRTSRRVRPACRVRRPPNRVGGSRDFSAGSATGTTRRSSGRSSGGFLVGRRIYVFYRISPAAFSCLLPVLRSAADASADCS